MSWLRLLSYLALFFLLVPVAVILFFGVGPLRTPAGYEAQVLSSIALSLVSSGLAALIDVIAFTPLAYHLAREESAIAESLVDIPAGIPHPIIGIALVLLGSPLTPFGRFLQSLGIGLLDSMTGLVAALVIMSAPIYVKSMQPYFEARDPSAEEFAMGMGASRWKTLLSVVLPNSARGLANASLISMSRALSEYGSVSIVAFYVLQYPFYGVSPASVQIVQYFNGFVGLGAAITASATMILVSLPLVMVSHFIRGKRND